MKQIILTMVFTLFFSSYMNAQHDKESLKLQRILKHQLRYFINESEISQHLGPPLHSRDRSLFVYFLFIREWSPSTGKFEYCFGHTLKAEAFDKTKKSLYKMEVDNRVVYISASDQVLRNGLEDGYRLIQSLDSIEYEYLKIKYQKANSSMYHGKNYFYHIREIDQVKTISKYNSLLMVPSEVRHNSFYNSKFLRAIEDEARRHKYEMKD